MRDSTKGVRALSLSQFVNIKWLLSFESCFVLFLFAGVYKAGRPLAALPVDLTALFGFLSLLVGGFILVRRGFLVSRAGVVLVLSYFAFALIAVATLAYTPGHEYALKKAVSLLTLDALALGGTAVIIGASWERAVRFFVALVALASIVALSALATYTRSSGTDTISVFGANYLGVSHFLSVGAVVLFGIVVFFSPGWGVRLSCTILLTVLLVAMLVSGGRGPLIAFALSALVALFVRLPRSRTARLYRLGLASLLITLVVALGYFVAREPTATVRRFGALLDPGLGTSGGTRLDYYKEAVNLWSQRLILGHGIGAWPILTGIGDQRGYPHDILLEIGVEEGLLGVLTFGWLCYVGLRYTLRRLRQELEPVVVTALMLVVNTFVGASLSGDLVDNRAFFAAIGLCAIACLAIPRSGRVTFASSQSALRQQTCFRSPALRASYRPRSSSSSARRLTTS